AFLGDEIYIKAGMEIPSQRHYGNYPQIEDGVGMVRSFLNAFEKVLHRGGVETRRAEPPALAGGSSADVRTNPAAIKPKLRQNPPAYAGGSPLYGTILTGEMFAPILSEQVERFNRLRKTRLTVLAVPNTYFGGDVSVAGLLTGQDYLAIKNKI